MFGGCSSSGTSHVTSFSGYRRLCGPPAAPDPAASRISPISSPYLTAFWWEVTG